MSSNLVSQIESIITTVALTRQDVLELTECIIQEYLTQQQQLNESDIEDNEQTVAVEIDDEGDCIDKEGYIYDVKTRIRIGQKDLKTKEKTMYNVV